MTLYIGCNLVKEHTDLVCLYVETFTESLWMVGNCSCLDLFWSRTLRLSVFCVKASSATIVMPKCQRLAILEIFFDDKLGGRSVL